MESPLSCSAVHVYIMNTHFRVSVKCRKVRNPFLQSNLDSGPIPLHIYLRKESHHKSLRNGALSAYVCGQWCPSMLLAIILQSLTQFKCRDDYHFSSLKFSACSFFCLPSERLSFSVFCHGQLVPGILLGSVWTTLCTVLSAPANDMVGGFQVVINASLYKTWFQEWNNRGYFVIPKSDWKYIYFYLIKLGTANSELVILRLLCFTHGWVEKE